tara:strand:+ start:461 stop:1081 length:621 start_codon:yes stop_codon:yes gene_type:complete
MGHMTQRFDFLSPVAFGCLLGLAFGLTALGIFGLIAAIFAGIFVLGFTSYQIALFNGQKNAGDPDRHFFADNLQDSVKSSVESLRDLLEAGPLIPKPEEQGPDRKSKIEPSIFPKFEDSYSRRKPSKAMSNDRHLFSLGNEKVVSLSEVELPINLGELGTRIVSISIRNGKIISEDVTVRRGDVHGRIRHRKRGLKSKKVWSDSDS